MFRKTFVPLMVFVLLALAVAGVPSLVHAGGVCGGTWVAEAGDTVTKLAATCGTTVEAIYAANPGISNVLTIGQALTIPGLSPAAPVTPVPTNPYHPSPINTGTYIVKQGDTFSSIAKLYGISLHELWGANPHILDINLLYAGQTVYIPAAYHGGAPSAPAAKPGPLAWGSAPKNAPHGSITLVNKSEMDVYVSLQSTRADGTLIIREYPVRGTMKVEMPAGWLVYVAWVGNEKYSGAFQLRGETSHTITFSKNKVVAD